MRLFEGQLPALRQAPVSAQANYGMGRWRGSSGPLIFRPLMKRPVDPVTQGVGGLVCECLVQIAEDDTHEEVLLPGVSAPRRTVII
jgi:hypothetical protein